MTRTSAFFAHGLATDICADFGFLGVLLEAAAQSNALPP